MCGIIGYAGKRDAGPILLDGLAKLEYRGYDSAGLCVLEHGRLHIIKRKGKVAELERAASTVSGALGIAHTRWATHGQPNEINAHPHGDCTGNIAIVHNGIIENYASLKELLVTEGHKIVSETDSEVIAHVIEKFYEGDFQKAVEKTLALLEGTYGLLAMDARSRHIVAAKKGSPLVIGIGNGEMFVASDVSAIISHTKNVVYVDDGEMAVVTPEGYAIHNVSGQAVDKTVQQIQWTVAEIEKGGFKHFMLKEIFEQPEALENTLRGRLSADGVKLSIAGDVSQIQRITITACGTSWHSALIGKYLIEKLAGIPVEVDYASEFRYRNPIVRANDLLVVLSQSGETADTLAALKEAKTKGAKTLGIINVVGSTIAREVDSGIYLHAGPEIGVASTKAFTCQVAALLLLALRLQKEPDKKLPEELLTLSGKIRETLKLSVKIRAIAEKFKGAKNFLYLGRNVNFPVALEGALKLKEISYIHAEGYPAAEMKHGPIALVDSQMPVVFIAPKDETYGKIMSNMQEVKARGGNIIAVVNDDDANITELAAYVIKVPRCAAELSPVINNIPLQLLAYHIADMKGLDVDRPRNLAKSVTVE